MANRRGVNAFGDWTRGSASGKVTANQFGDRMQGSFSNKLAKGIDGLNGKFTNTSTRDAS